MYTELKHSKSCTVIANRERCQLLSSQHITHLSSKPLKAELLSKKYDIRFLGVG